MNRSLLLRSVGVVVVGALVGTMALAQPGKDSKAPAAAQPGKDAKAPAQPKLPEGMTQADMQACMEAGKPGPMHAWLHEAVGVWTGKTKMWMTPDSEPLSSVCTTTISSMMDGRFTKVETAGEMPGMGPFSGFGIYGYDNVAQKFQSTWVDSCGTGMSIGVGDLSSDGKTLTWSFTFNCPMTKKPVVMRQIEHRVGKDSFTLEMHMNDPKSGKEYKMMEIAFTRKAEASAAK